MGRIGATRRRRCPVILIAMEALTESNPLLTKAGNSVMFCVTENRGWC